MFIVQALCFASIFKAGVGFTYLGDPFISVEISPPIFVDVGDTVQIPCLAYENIDGFSKIATPVVWHKENGTPDENLNHDDGTLTINNIKLIDSGIYVCQSETSEQFKRRISISVRDPSRLLLPFTPHRELSPNVEPITIQPSHFSGYPGDIIVLACFNSVNQNASYVWSKNGIKPLPSHFIIRGGILIIKWASIEDGGRYLCESFFTTGSGENFFFSNEANVIVLANESSGFEEENTEIGTESRIIEGHIETETENQTMTETTTELEIETQTKIQFKDQVGDQIAQSQPKSNTETPNKIPEQNPLMPFVLLSPLLTISPNSREILNLKEGDQLILFCSAEGIPSPRVKWAKSDGNFNQINLVTSVNNIALIEIPKVNSSDSGKYTCTAFNDAGTSEESIQVLVQSQQTTIEGDSLSVKMENSFECSAEQSACENGVCIELYQICDGIQDCSEGEDEDYENCYK